MKFWKKRSFISETEASSSSSQSCCLGLLRSPRWAAGAFFWSLAQDVATCLVFPSELGLEKLHWASHFSTSVPRSHPESHYGVGVWDPGIGWVVLLGKVLAPNVEEGRTPPQWGPCRAVDEEVRITSFPRPAGFLPDTCTCCRTRGRSSVLDKSTRAHLAGLVSIWNHKERALPPHNPRLCSHPFLESLCFASLCFSLLNLPPFRAHTPPAARFPDTVPDSLTPHMSVNLSCVPATV